MLIVQKYPEMGKPVAGVVEYEKVEVFEHPSSKVQLWVYDTCIQRYRGMHQWMAFIDVDEFLIITDTHAQTMPDLLKGYEGFGALAVNWQVGPPEHSNPYMSGMQS